MAYLKGCPALPRIIDIKGNLELHTWTDASYALHCYMKGHTGGITSVGRGAVIHNCSKQKLNTKSSTESEVVGVSDYLPHTMWAKYFLEAQGYHLARNVFYQDNTSAIKMITNGRKSCSGKSRHIHIRYFFTKDVIKRENMEVRYCPTKEMIADFYTKPLQGRQFYTLRNKIMGVEDTSLAKECVDNDGEEQKQEMNKITTRVTSNHITHVVVKLTC